MHAVEVIIIEGHFADVAPVVFLTFGGIYFEAYLSLFAGNGDSVAEVISGEEDLLAVTAEAERPFMKTRV